MDASLLEAKREEIFFRVYVRNLFDILVAWLMWFVYLETFWGDHVLQENLGCSLYRWCKDVKLHWIPVSLVRIWCEIVDAVVEVFSLNITCLDYSRCWLFNFERGWWWLDGIFSMLDCYLIVWSVPTADDCGHWGECLRYRCCCCFAR